jgi:hypothetical protein
MKDQQIRLAYALSASPKADRLRKAKVFLPARQWVDINPLDLDLTERNTVWDLYSLSYGSIGTHITSVASLVSKYNVLKLIDVDSDEDIDAFIAYKTTRFGNKFGVMGTDGSSAAKRAALSQIVHLLKSPGWFGEASHKMAEIFEASGVPRITDLAVVSEILQNKNIDWLGDGYYQRQLGEMGQVRKALYGHPRGFHTNTE